MDQKNMRNSKKLPKALNQEELRQVKGGYREAIGIAAGAQFVRWDEVDIRFNGEDSGNFQGLQVDSVTTNTLRFGRARR